MERLCGIQARIQQVERGVHVTWVQFSTSIYDVVISLLSQRKRPESVIQVLDYMIRQTDSLLLRH